MRTEPDKLTVAQVERTLKWPSARWPGNCFAVASKIVEAKLVRGVAVYGHWCGRVSPKCTVKEFYDRFTHHAPLHHGWVKLPDGRVLDPTRWVFEARRPYIYVGEAELPCDNFDSGGDPLEITCRACGHTPDEHSSDFFSRCYLCGAYDEGGNRWREATLQPPPEPDGKKFVLKARADTLNKVRTFGVGNGATGSVRIAYSQLFWLANLPYDALCPHTEEVYRAIDRAGRPGLVPIDNMRRAQRERPDLWKGKRR